MIKKMVYFFFLNLLHLLKNLIFIKQSKARDLIFFISIILIFICAFGVITQATMYPGNKLDFNLITNIFDKAYWPIYGELKSNLF